MELSHQEHVYRPVPPAYPMVFPGAYPTPVAHIATSSNYAVTSVSHQNPLSALHSVIPGPTVQRSDSFKGEKTSRESRGSFPASSRQPLVLKERDITLIKVPEVVAQKWLQQPSGSVLGIQIQDRITLPKKALQLDIGDLQAHGDSKITSSERELIVLNNNCVEGSIRYTKVFVPNMKKVSAKLWAAQQLRGDTKMKDVLKPRLMSAAESKELQTSLRRNSHSENRLFRYLTPTTEKNSSP